MKRIEGSLELSATDLVGYLNCRHLSELDRAVAEGALLKPKVRDDLLLQILWERGLVHEQNYVEHLTKEGLEAVRIDGVEVTEALLHGPEQIADLPVPVAESPGAVRIGHPERSHLVEYLAPNSVFNSLPRQRSSPHLRPDDRLVTIDRVLHHASLGVA